MKKICERGLNWFQIYDHEGSVRLCSWTRDGYIGKLSQNGAKELYHSEQANMIRKRLCQGDYSMCKVDACPYLAMNDIESHLIDIDEVPEYPEELYLGFEQVCNYACTCCTIHDTMIKNSEENLEESYKIIEEKIKDILPHVKKISANGCGELFVSKHTLNILSNWKPLASSEEVEVLLETNGSMFDEKHWKQIENLGQYNLRVAISVMSFDEAIYQYLSGTTLPISRIEDNLRFVKSLREKNIVNYLEIATVVQEQNFRTMPEFAIRCIEEFGADYVRLRPYEPWGAESPDVAWFNDIRNPAHPYYKEYKKVMQNPIFKHPKVFDWSGGLDSENATVSPYRLSLCKERIITELCLNIDDVVNRLQEKTDSKSVIVYGIGNIGKVLVRQLNKALMKVDYIIDKNSENVSFDEIVVYNLENLINLNKDIPVIITPLVNDKAISKVLKSKGYNQCVSIKELMHDQKILMDLREI